MKKILLGLIITLFIFNIFSNENNNINNELIRIRVLANSNSEYDLNVKENVSADLKKELYKLLVNVNDINNARKTINDNMNSIDNIVSRNLENVNYSYQISYGLNYFPEKKYNDITYEAGEYESLLVTLGKGEGENWWCILFPPFCLLEAEESSQKVEYSFFLGKLFDKIFH